MASLKGQVFHINVPKDKTPSKRTGTGQAWFPESWANDKIKNGGKNMITKVKLIISDRSKLHDEDDYNIEICRERLIEVLSKDYGDTILILNQLDEKEILLVSEVFEEIAYNLQSNRYIECLKSILKKYPNLNLEDSIEVTQEYMD